MVFVIFFSSYPLCLFCFFHVSSSIRCVLLRRLPFFAVLQYRGGCLLVFSGFLYFLFATECCILFFLVDVPVTIFCVFFFNSPASSSSSLGSIISNKRTLYCFVSSICLLVCCCLWVVCACECRFGCFYVCVWVLQLVLRFLLLSPLSSCLHSLSRPNFRNRHQKGMSVPEMREGYLLVRFRWFASVFILFSCFR